MSDNDDLYHFYEDEDIDNSTNDTATRVELCNKRWVTTFDPHTGYFRSFPFRCGIWRECPLCRSERAEREKNRVKDGFRHYEGLYLIETDHETATEMARLLGKDKYRRYPHDDHDYMFVAQCEELDEALSMLPEDIQPQRVSILGINDMPWADIINVPSSNKISGNLGRTPSTSSSPRKASIEVECVITDADPQTVSEAAQEAIAATIDENPSTIEDVKHSLHRRISAYKKILLEKGCKIELTYVVNMTVDESAIKWEHGEQGEKLILPKFYPCFKTI